MDHYEAQGLRDGTGIFARHAVRAGRIPRVRDEAGQVAGRSVQSRDNPPSAFALWHTDVIFIFGV